MNYFFEVLLVILGNLLTTVILSLVAYIFRKKIKFLFSSNKLLSQSQVPHILVNEISNTYHDKNKFGISLMIENQGNTNIEDVRLFVYKHIDSQSQNVEIKHLKYIHTYICANPGCGEKLSLSFYPKRDKQFELPTSDDGFLLEFTDSLGTIFYQLLYIRIDENGCPSPIPQVISRAKKRLPQRKINKSDDYLSKKYGMVFARG